MREHGRPIPIWWKDVNFFNLLSN